jgi:hypothetical protein
VYDVKEGPGKIKIQNWSKVAMDEDAWNRIVEQTTTHSEVQRQEEKDTSICSVSTKNSAEPAFQTTTQ